MITRLIRFKENINLIMMKLLCDVKNETVIIRGLNVENMLNSPIY